MAQVIQGRNAEYTFVWVDFEAMVLKAGEKLAEVFQVLLVRGGGNEAVINVDYDGVHPSDDFIHEALEGLSHVTEPEVHEGVFKQPQS